MDTIGRITYAAPSMKAIRLVHQGRPLELHDVPMPQPGAHDVLIRVKAAGVCHSDAHYRTRRETVSIRRPRVPSLSGNVRMLQLVF